MAEFDTLLEKYGELSAEITETRDYLVSLTRDREEIRKRLKAISRNGGIKHESNADDKESASIDSAMEDTVKAVRTLGNNVNAAQLAEHLNISQDAARLRLQRAEKKRLIIRIAFGRYGSKPEMNRPTTNGTKPAEREAKTESTTA